MEKQNLYTRIFTYSIFVVPHCSFEKCRYHWNILWLSTTVNCLRFLYFSGLHICYKGKKLKKDRVDTTIAHIPRFKKNIYQYQPYLYFSLLKRTASSYVCTSLTVSNILAIHRTTDTVP